ncbi:MAG: hypothetical protein ACJ76Y_32560 [Thermoanaerobaculia bacterium]
MLGGNLDHDKHSGENGERLITRLGARVELEPQLDHLLVEGGKVTLTHSVFPDGDFRVDPLLVFVAMPFAPEFNTLYEAVESLLVEHCHLKCLRADAISRNGSITAEIWRHVNEAMCVIADLSGRNANVFYEVGLAHALGKPVVLLSYDISDVPFDLRHLRIVQYDYGAGLTSTLSDWRRGLAFGCLGGVKLRQGGI